MAKFIRLSQDQRDNLIAYLDGELEESATQEIEQVLASSEVARHEIDMLSRSWDLLNVLPAHRASPEFCEKTVEMLRSSEEKVSRVDTAVVARQGKRAVILAFWGLLVGGVGFVGYTAARHWIPNDSEALLEDFEIINNLDAFRDAMTPVNAENSNRPTEFLEMLRDKRTFAESADHAGK